MPLASRARQRLRLGCPLDWLNHSQDSGFSLVEVLVATAVLVTALVGIAGAFNLVTNSLGKTSNNNAVNIAIDDDIARVKGLAYDYTSCVEPTGSVPAPGSCDVSRGSSTYYFPKSASDVEKNKFFAACQASSPSAHIVAGFIDAIKNLPAVDSGVKRKTVQRENENDSANHTVLIEYELDGSVVRMIKVVPVVSAWCG